jgi:Adenosine deaminase
VNVKTGQLGDTSTELIHKQIPVEVHLTSHIPTNSCKRFDEHPIKDLISIGFIISSNTDNRLITNTTVSKVTQIAESLRIANVQQLLINSATYSFIK